MHILVASLFIGCGSDSPPEDLVVDEKTATDAIAVAFGGCTTTRSDLLDDADYATATVTYDENGDPVSGTNAYAEYTDYASTWVATYGAPHELTSQTVTYTHFPEYDWLFSATWADGHVTYSTYDMGIDGDADYESWSDYDGGDLVHYEEDADGDGTVDESLECVTAAEGDGTRVTCEGTGAAGTATSEQVTDADGHFLSYDYADASGAESHATWFEYGAAGESGDRETEEWADFALTYEDSTTVEFDGLGRRSHQLNTQVDHTMGDTITTFEYTYSYDCP